MRIISGKFGGRKINPPQKMPYTRPTTDIAKEGLFNVISNNLEMEGLHTLDLFGGTGSISYELASRGAIHQVIVEKDPHMYAFISKCVKVLELPDTTVVKEEVFKFINQCNEQFDFIFAGPPYALPTIEQLPAAVRDHKLMKKGGWFVLEHSPVHQFENEPLFKAVRHYGTTFFSIFVNS